MLFKYLLGEKAKDNRQSSRFLIKYLGFIERYYAKLNSITKKTIFQKL